MNTLEDENYYVLEGNLTFRLDERTVEAPAGTFVHIPKGMVHTHWNATAAPVKLLAFPAPSGFETFFADLAELMASMPPGPPDMGRMAETYGKYGLQVVGPPSDAGAPGLTARLAGQASQRSPRLTTAGNTRRTPSR